MIYIPIEKKNVSTINIVIYNDMADKPAPVKILWLVNILLVIAITNFFLDHFIYMIKRSLVKQFTDFGNSIIIIKK